LNESTILLPLLQNPAFHEAVAMPDGCATYASLATAADAVAARLTPGERVALWADASLATVVGLLGALRVGAPVVPVNPKSGRAELRHVLDDARPAAVLAGGGAALPDAFKGVPRLAPEFPAGAPAGTAVAEPDAEADALIIYTSGTTGLPKGVIQTRRSLIVNLDALYDAWAWTAEDRLIHALPLFHVHGLVLGMIGPLRRGGHVRHLGGFTPEAVVAALQDGATMLFGVPTMYHRLATGAGASDHVAAVLGAARLLVSGSSALSADDFRRLERATGQQVVERYGMTETVMITAGSEPVRSSSPSRATRRSRRPLCSAWRTRTSASASWPGSCPQPTSRTPSSSTTSHKS
jgi:malonyl-CoA/methylmalonyl-CoA synthetase